MLKFHKNETKEKVVIIKTFTPIKGRNSTKVHQKQNVVGT
jgi:hypothetical protein